MAKIVTSPSNNDHQVLVELFRLLSNAAIADRVAFLGVDALQKLKDLDALTTEDTEKLKILGDMGIQNDNCYSAIQAYSMIHDEDGLRQAVDMSAKDHSFYDLDRLLCDDTKLEQAIGKRKAIFYKSKGYDTKKVPSFSFTRAANAASKLTPKYDLAIGIPKGGLYSSFYFSLFGLPVILAQTHQTPSRVTFKWVDAPEGIEGKRVIVLDKDVVTGRSLTRALKEINKYSPKSIDLFLNHDPPISNLGAIPIGFGQVYYPEIMDYSNFFDTYLQVKEKLGVKK